MTYVLPGVGKGGFHGGQPVYLDFLTKDGSWGGEAFGFQNNTLNASNRINPGDMNRVFVEDLLAELDHAEEYWVDDLTNERKFTRNLPLVVIDGYILTQHACDLQCTWRITGRRAARRQRCGSGR